MSSKIDVFKNISFEIGSVENLSLQKIRFLKFDVFKKLKPSKIKVFKSYSFKIGSFKILSLQKMRFSNLEEVTVFKTRHLQKVKVFKI